MTYSAGSPISATDYNTFIASMNTIYADTNSGATTYPTASYGYGQTPALTTVSADNSISAAKWAELYDSIRDCGTHQGTTVVPPLPSSNPSAGDPVEIYAGLDTLIALIETNRLDLAVGQTASTNQSYSQPSSTPWIDSLTFSMQVDLGTWNNARYFFNSGGFVSISGNYSPVVTPEDTMWQSVFSTMSPVKLSATTTEPFSGTNAGTGEGFYGLTTTYQEVYRKAYGAGGVYTNSYITIEAKLNATAGTNGKIDIRVSLFDEETGVVKSAKNGTTTYTIAEAHSSGVIAWPGTAALGTGTFVSV